MAFKKWLTEQVGANVATTLLALAVGTMLTYLKLHQSTWASPLLYGTAGAALIWMAGFATIAMSRIPKLRTRITLGNIEKNVRNWLDRSGAAVKTDPTPGTFFRFTAQLQGSSTIIVGRTTAGLTEHIFILANIVSDKNMPSDLQAASPQERERLLELIRLELARAKVGYFGLGVPIQQFSITKNIRITDHLTEEEFMRAVWDVEAAVHATGSLYNLWRRRETAAPSGENSS